MGFTVVPLAQKARTATLIADSDLNLGNYDLIATDVKGDTAEFDEFVGGVGNFESGLISGGLDVSGIMHAESTLQVDGNIILEGSVNNVNIADDGEITTTKGVNGADFNGAKITANKFNGATIDTSGNITGVKGTFSGAVTGSTINGASVTSNKFNGATIDTSGNITGVKGTFSGAVSGTTGTFSGAVQSTKFNRTTNYNVSSTAPSNFSAIDGSLRDLVCILPVREKPYNGSVILKRKTLNNGVAYTIQYITSLSQTAYSNVTMPATTNGTCTITLSNAQCLYINVNQQFIPGSISIS